MPVTVDFQPTDEQNKAWERAKRGEVDCPECQAQSIATISLEVEKEITRTACRFVRCHNCQSIIAAHLIGGGNTTPDGRALLIGATKIKIENE